MSHAPSVPRSRGIYCNRTLNLRTIRAIGYDMDYTLIQYRSEAWERRAYGHLRQKLAALGWPVSSLEFDVNLVIRGLVLDVEEGNILKANRFGYIKQAFHGTQPIDHERQRRVYARTIVGLKGARFHFVNTLFSLSEVCMFMQLVDLLDDDKLPGVLGYSDLYRHVRQALDEAHMEGQLKAEILEDPERFIEHDPDLPLALLDQKHAGKKLLLITNSEWPYSRDIMRYAFDPHLPGDMTWRDLFDLIIVGARKPAFFSTRSPMFEVVDEEGLLRPVVGALEEGGIYLGGHAPQVEAHLGLAGDQILYVGDHMYGDVHASKSVLRWRTAVVLSELEREVDAIAAFEGSQATLSALMKEKEALEADYCDARVALLRAQRKYGPVGEATIAELEKSCGRLRHAITEQDERIAPHARASSELSNNRWGLLMRAGNDKSFLARQVERHADIYMSRVSNFLYHTPYVYLRSRRGSLPHDP